MKTDDLIHMLANGPVEAAPNGTWRRYAIALGWGAAGAVLLLASGLGVRQDLSYVATLPLFWFKVLFMLSLAALSLPIGVRLARPGMTSGRWPLMLAVPVLIFWGVAAVTMSDTAPDERVQLLMGETWKACSALIAMLSVPVFVAVIWATKGLAPVRLRQAGAAAGLLSGSLAALIYCLHCTELQAPFVAVWYLLGIAIPTLAGALLGPRLLRW